MLLSPPLYLNSKKTACTHCIFCKHDNFFIYLFGQGYPITFISEPLTPPPPRLHGLTRTCTYVLSWWERERNKIQQLLWALKEKRSTMIDQSNCRWSVSDNPAQSLGCDCWPASLCLACSMRRDSREHAKWNGKKLGRERAVSLPLSLHCPLFPNYPHTFSSAFHFVLCTHGLLFLWLFRGWAIQWWEDLPNQTNQGTVIKRHPWHEIRKIHVDFILYSL